VKTTKFVAQIGIAAVALGVALGTVAPAGATNNIKPYGTQETLKDIWGNSEIGYTVDGLGPSTDVVPAQINGQLYEASVTVDAVQGSVTPNVMDFNARAQSGANYRVLGVSTLPGGPLGPGGTSTGKLYFDVVGDVPNSVVYNDGSQDLMAWISP